MEKNILAGKTALPPSMLPGALQTPRPQAPWALQWSGPDRSLQNLMHFRYYGSNIGRFMKPDNVTGSPLNPQNWNLYSYVRGNPVGFNDPSGHEALARLAPPGGSVWDNMSGLPPGSHGGGGGGANDPPSSGAGTAPKPGDSNFVGPVAPPSSTIGSSDFVGPLNRPYTTFDGSSLSLFNKNGTQQNFKARAGHLDENGNSQPALQDAVDIGPIPEGVWSFNTKDIQHWEKLSTWEKAESTFSLGLAGEWAGGQIAWGNTRVWLTPITYTGPRSNFSIHGGSIYGSNGCVDLAGEESSFFNLLPAKATEILLFVNYH